MKLIFGFLICFCALLVSGYDRNLCAMKEDCQCRFHFEPVCATNGCSYANPCLMECAKATFWKNGQCKQHPHF